MSERIENSFGRPPRCPECGEETVVKPEDRSGLCAVVGCIDCDYMAVFHPAEGER